MNAAAAPQAPATALQRYLRLLWRQAPAVLLEGEQGPALVHGSLRLPAHRRCAAGDDWSWHLAAAAHAGAHLAYSPRHFDGRGLRPIVRALMGVLEDARVEALAGRELPGLRRHWAALHTATPADGETVPALLARLSRALADPRYADPHPWIAKGRALFHADAAGEVLAVGDPALLRGVASRLGHDLGQMRAQFDARSWRPVPDYRDDNAWMWPAERADEAVPRPAQGVGDAPAAPAPRPPAPPVARLPEWDRLIGCMRPDWVQVHEDEVVAAADAAALPLPRPSLRAAVRSAAARPAQADGRQRPAETGDRTDPDALVRARIAQRLGRGVDVRVYRGAVRRPRRGCTVLLLDRSWSSGDPAAGAGGTVLQMSGQVTALLADALQARGTAVALYAFCSEGRGALRMTRLKAWAEPADTAVLHRRLGTLRPAGSTRLGAALRRALQLLRAQAARGPLSVVLVGDGQPHDIDVHDPRYLEADLRRALLEARRQRVLVHGIVIDGARGDVGVAGPDAGGAGWVQGSETPARALAPMGAPGAATAAASTAAVAAMPTLPRTALLPGLRLVGADRLPQAVARLGL